MVFLQSSNFPPSTRVAHRKNMLRRAVARPLGAAARPRRLASGHGHAEKKQYSGLEGQLRVYLPENEHMVLGVIGMYAVLYLGFKATRKAPKKAAPESAGDHHHHQAEDGDMPSILSEGFDKWSAQPGNMAKWEASLPLCASIYEGSH